MLVTIGVSSGSAMNSENHSMVAHAPSFLLHSMLMTQALSFPIPVSLLFCSTYTIAGFLLETDPQWGPFV